MEIMILSFIAALSYALILMKILGYRRFLRWSKPLDVIFTLGIPALVMSTGTFSAVVLAVMSGFIFTILTWALTQISKLKIPV
jgi:hypothetical protein